MSKSSEYKNNWAKNNVDRISLFVPKGEKEIIKDFAESHGESLNGFIVRLIREAMDKEAEE